MTYHCPIDGCSYKSENWKQVVGHCVGKKDDAHAGMSYQSVKAQLGVTEPRGSTKPTEPAETQTNTQTNTDALEPAMSQNEEKTEQKTCPECGSNRWFEPEGVPYERACADCSTDTEWTVYNT